MNVCKLTLSPFSKREKSRYDVHVHEPYLKTKDKEEHTYIRIRKKYFIQSSFTCSSLTKGKYYTIT